MPSNSKYGGLPTSNRPTSLDVLAPTDAMPNARRLQLEQIVPNQHQARQVFDAEALGDLTASVREYGVLEPILVRPLPGGKYEIVAGERRYRAAQAADLTEIPALIRDDLDDVAAAFITALENLQRQDLDLEDEARQFAYLQQVTGLSQRALAEKLGIGYNYLSRRVRLLDRPDLLAAVRAGTLPLLVALKQLGDDRQPEAAPAVSARHTDLEADDPVLESAQWERGDLPALTEDTAVSQRHTEPEAPAPAVSPRYTPPAPAPAPAPVPLGDTPRWRYLDSAHRELDRIRVAAVAPTERDTWAAELRALAARATQLAQALEDTPDGV